MTTVRASPSLLKRVHQLGIAPEDFGRGDNEEIIILRGIRRRGQRGADVEYKDTPFTRRARAELRGINSWLEHADIAFDEAFLGTPRAVDVLDRRLRRIFTRANFQSGGRLFGGFWQALKSEERLAGLTIEKQPVAYLDYGQMTARIAYGLVGATLPCDDLYSVEGLEPFREGVKKLVSALLFADAKLNRKPQGTANLLPKNYSIGELTERIRRTHSPIAHLFERGIGHHLQFKESEVLVEVLLALRDNELVALPVHDAILIRQDRTSLGADYMKRVFREKIGVEAHVNITLPPNHTTRAIGPF